MIISRKHRYIFLHCRKTAGSSICVSLARDLGPDDLQLSALSETQAEGIALTDRVLREAKEEQKKVGGFKSALALSGLRGEKRRTATRKALLLQRYRALLQEQQPQHAYAETIARAFPEDWANSRKFCVVRNPWTKCVSDYFWRIKGMSSPPTFSDFIDGIVRGDDLGGVIRLRYHDNWPLYTIDNEIVADKVLRFETLQDDLSAACTELGIPYDGWLPRAKGSHRPKSGKRSDPRSFYTPELRDTVGELYEKEITTFGYTF